MSPRARSCACLVAVAATLGTMGRAAAQEPAQAPAPGEEEEEPAPPQHKKVRFAAEVAPGFTYERVFDSGLTAFDLEGGAGVTIRRVTILLGGTYVRGSTTGGLGARGGNVGTGVDVAFDRLHLGGGLVFSYLEIDRATSPGATLWQLGAGVFAAVTLDLVPIDEVHAFFVRARLDAARYLSDDEDPRGGSGGPLVWGPTLSLGFRF